MRDYLILLSVRLATYSDISFVPSNLRTLLSSLSNHEESAVGEDAFISAQKGYKL